MNNRFAQGNILFLADKGDDHPEKTHALAPEIRLLGYNIYQTDNSFSQIQVTDENLTRIKVDHAQPFPFQEKKFDVIVMRRGKSFLTFLFLFQVFPFPFFLFTFFSFLC